MNRNVLIGFTVLLLLVGVGAKLGVEKFSKESSREQGQIIVSPTPTSTPIVSFAPSPTSAPSSTPTPVPTSKPVEIISETAIKSLLAKAYGVSVSSIDLRILKETPIHARGTFGYGAATSSLSPVFLAVKVNGVWQLAYYGRGIMSCQALESFKFPQSMIQDCRFVVKMGEPFSITVNKLDGIEWKMDFDTGYVEFSGKKEAESKKEELYTFKGLKKGNTEITFFSLEKLMGQEMPLSREVVHEITIE